MMALDTSSSVALGCIFVTRPMLTGTPRPVQHPTDRGFRRGAPIDARIHLSEARSHDTIRTDSGAAVRMSPVGVDRWPPSSVRADDPPSDGGDGSGRGLSRRSLLGGAGSAPRLDPEAGPLENVEPLVVDGETA